MLKEIKVKITNIFINHDEETFKAEFTKKWIKIINQAEKIKIIELHK